MTVDVLADLPNHYLQACTRAEPWLADHSQHTGEIPVLPFFCCASSAFFVVWTINLDKLWLVMFCSSNWTSDKKYIHPCDFYVCMKSKKSAYNSTTIGARNALHKPKAPLPRQEITPISCHRRVPSALSRLSAQNHVFCRLPPKRVPFPHKASADFFYRQVIFIFCI
jgi:hypothetical protein